jgi:mannose-6-phosphate isomerase-like protein (cupin superfamily)
LVRIERTLWGTMWVGILTLCFVSAIHAQDIEYERSSAGLSELTLGSGTTIKLLLDASNLGSAELEVAEITFPAGSSPSRGHAHGAIEIFYVIEGVLGHVVNGELFQIEPGMVGVVRQGDEVAHRVLSEGPVRALVLWAPGGEAARIAPPERWGPIGQ